MSNLSLLLERLADSGLEFVIVGGFAALTHGSSYMTRDVDICTVLSDENVDVLREAFRDWNPRHRMTASRLSFLEHPTAGQSVNNLYLETDHGMLDVLSSVKGLGAFDEVRANAEVFEVDGRKFPVVGLADLIRAKEAMGRPRDLLVVAELRAIAAKRGIPVD